MVIDEIRKENEDLKNLLVLLEKHFDGGDKIKVVYKKVQQEIERKELVEELLKQELASDENILK